MIGTIITYTRYLTDKHTRLGHYRFFFYTRRTILQPTNQVPILFLPQMYFLVLFTLQFMRKCAKCVNWQIFS